MATCGLSLAPWSSDGIPCPVFGRQEQGLQSAWSVFGRQKQGLQSAWSVFGRQKQGLQSAWSVFGCLGQI